MKMWSLQSCEGSTDSMKMPGYGILSHTMSLLVYTAGIESLIEAVRVKCDCLPTVEGLGTTSTWLKGGALQGTHLKLMGQSPGVHSAAHQLLRRSVSWEFLLQVKQFSSSKQVRQSLGQKVQILSFFKSPNLPSGQIIMHLISSRYCNISFLLFV